MSNQLKVKPSDLAKVWSLTKSAEQKQFTLRVPSETFCKIQALEAMFPGRSRNEMVSDLLATAIDEFVDGLPEESREVPGQCIQIGFDEYSQEPITEPVFEYFGPRADFQRLVRQAQNDLAKNPDLKIVEGKEEAA